MSDPIRFLAEVYKVQTLVDGGVRLVLDLPETAIMQMAQLAECQRFSVVLEIEARPCITGKVQSDNGEKQYNLAERKKRKSKWSAQERAETDGSS